MPQGGCGIFVDECYLCAFCNMDYISESLVPRLASAVIWSRGPRPWRGFTHGPLITDKCPIRVLPDQETNMAMERGGGWTRNGALTAFRRPAGPGPGGNDRERVRGATTKVISH